MVYQCPSCLIIIVIVHCLKPTGYLRKSRDPPNESTWLKYLHKHEPCTFVQIIFSKTENSHYQIQWHHITSLHYVLVDTFPALSNTLMSHHNHSLSVDALIMV